MTVFHAVGWTWQGNYVSKVFEHVDDALEFVKDRLSSFTIMNDKGSIIFDSSTSVLKRF